MIRVSLDGPATTTLGSSNSRRREAAEQAVPAAASPTGEQVTQHNDASTQQNATNHGSFRTKFTPRLDSASIKTFLDGYQAQTRREAAQPTAPTATNTSAAKPTAKPRPHNSFQQSTKHASAQDCPQETDPTFSIASTREQGLRASML